MSWPRRGADPFQGAWAVWKQLVVKDLEPGPESSCSKVVGCVYVVLLVEITVDLISRCHCASAKRHGSHGLQPWTSLLMKPTIDTLSSLLMHAPLASSWPLAALHLVCTSLPTAE